MKAKPVDRNTRLGAEMSAAAIQEYWAKLGYDVRPRIAVKHGTRNELAAIYTPCTIGQFGPDGFPIKRLGLDGLPEEEQGAA